MRELDPEWTQEHLGDVITAMHAMVNDIYEGDIRTEEEYDARLLAIVNLLNRITPSNPEPITPDVGN